VESHGKGNLRWLPRRGPRVGTGFEYTGPPSRYTNGFLNSNEGSWVGGGGASAWNSKEYIAVVYVCIIYRVKHTWWNTPNYSTK